MTTGAQLLCPRGGARPGSVLGRALARPPAANTSYTMWVLSVDEFHDLAVRHQPVPQQVRKDGLIGEESSHQRSVLQKLFPNRPFRNCQPRDLLLQIRNYCNYNRLPIAMTTESFDFAADCYFSVM